MGAEQIPDIDWELWEKQVTGLEEIDPRQAIRQPKVKKNRLGRIGIEDSYPDLSVVELVQEEQIAELEEKWQQGRALTEHERQILEIHHDPTEDYW
jgi:hypothetical protein